MVGMVVTISPSFSLYKMVVLPAASSPTCEDRRALSECSRHASKVLGNTQLGTYHENSHLLLREEAGKELGKGQPHLEGTSPASTRFSRSATLCAPQE